MKNINKFLELYPNAPEVFHTALENCKGSPEHPIYHPEGTLEVHLDVVLSRCFERDSKELHFAGILHDILKHGICETLWGDERKGKLKTIEEGVYYQNVMHATHARDFIKIPEVSAWMKSHGVGMNTVKTIVGNHMRMKNYIAGEKGRKNGMRESKRKIMKEKLSNVWDELYYFSTYCDNMLYIKY